MISEEIPLPLLTNYGYTHIKAACFQIYKMVKLGTVLDFLDTYRGRDKVLRTLCYGSKCMAGLSSNPELAGRLDNFSGTLSSCRATLRLLDDIPMLAYTAEYGLGDKVGTTLPLHRAH